MPMTRRSAVTGPFHRLFESGCLAARDDADLLDRFAQDGDEFAFESLIGRHGPRVLAVCRRILRDPNDVDDAFQATFLVLVRRSASLRGRIDLGPWLMGVASRTSRKIRAVSGRRRAREASNPVEPAAPFSLRPEADVAGVIEEELARLPERYRDPIVLCLLEGQSRREAAHRLGLAEGTVSSRISRGKTLLGRRLSRRDLAPSTILPAVAPKLLQSTIRAAQDAAARRIAEVGTPAIVSLTKGFVPMLMQRKFEVAAALAVALATIGATSGLGQPPAPAHVEEPKAAAEAKPAEIDPRLKPIQGVWYLVGIKFEAKDKDGKPVETKIDLENQAISFDSNEAGDSELYGRAFQRATSFGVVKLVIDGDRVAYMIGDIEYVSAIKIDRGDKELEVTLHQLAQGLVGGKKTPEMALVPRTPPPPVGESQDSRVKVRLEGDLLSWIQPLNQGVAPGEFSVQAPGVMLANNMIFRKLTGPEHDVDGYIRKMEPELHPERHPKREVPDEPSPSIDLGAFENEAKALEGTWVEVAMLMRGQFQPTIPGMAGGLALKFDGSSDSVRITEGTGAPVSLRYRIDPATEVRSIDLFQPRPGSDRVEVIRALYRVRGEIMTLVISDHPDRRPTTLTAGEKDPQTLVTLIRLRSSVPTESSRKAE